MNKNLQKLIENFNIKNTQTDEKYIITGRPATKNYSIEENANRLVEQIINSTAKVKENYQFQNGKELLMLLEGMALEENKGVTYWDYIETDTLLSLQKPKTNYPDENIFIMYHQQCEIYFKLIIQELDLILDLYRAEENKKFPLTDTNVLPNKVDTWIERLKRINRYWDNLIMSFNILKDGFSKAEFNHFRKTLMPASGLQSFQFRQIELMLTEIENLTIPSSNKIKDLYWQKSSTQITDGKPSKILVNFNKKYKKYIEEIITNIENKTLFSLFEKNLPTNEEVKSLLIELDNNILLWKIAHMQMIYAHIPKESGGTGGTDYSKYLPQFIQEKGEKVAFNKTQQVLYFPKLWKVDYANQRIKDHIVSFKQKLQNTVDATFPQENPTGIKKH